MKESAPLLSPTQPSLVARAVFVLQVGNDLPGLGVDINSDCREGGRTICRMAFSGLNNFLFQIDFATDTYAPLEKLPLRGSWELRQRLVSDVALYGE
jgi:hypothetical protein